MKAIYLISSRRYKCSKPLVRFCVEELDEAIRFVEAHNKMEKLLNTPYYWRYEELLIHDLKGLTF